MIITIVIFASLTFGASFCIGLLSASFGESPIIALVFVPVMLSTIAGVVGWLLWWIGHIFLIGLRLI